MREVSCLKELVVFRETIKNIGLKRICSNCNGNGFKIKKRTTRKWQRIKKGFNLHCLQWQGAYYKLNNITLK